MGRDTNKTGQVSHGPAPAIIPKREAMTRTQLETLHSVVATLSPFILGPQRHWMMDEDATPKKIDGGAAASAVVTFIKVCERIDSIMEDKTRWDMSAHDDLYASIKAVQSAQVKFLETQTDAVKKPSYRFRPIVANDGFQFICYHGDITRSGYAIVGVGRTPQEALDAFDAAFSKAPHEQIIMASEAADETKPKRKKKDEEPPTGNLI